MNLIMQSEDMQKYLASSSIVDYYEGNIQRVARELSEGLTNETEIVKRVYEYVRDEIHHSADINGEIVTCRASEVLKYKQGVCYAKSHLLAAILRFIGIPTGFCYQGLTADDENNNVIVLHGLNAVFLKSVEKWIRLDARGNMQGINAQFSVQEERLAYPIRSNFGEYDYPVIYAEPNENVVSCLKKYSSFRELLLNLPGSLE